MKKYSVHFFKLSFVLIFIFTIFFSPALNARSAPVFSKDLMNGCHINTGSETAMNYLCWITENELEDENENENDWHHLIYIHLFYFLPFSDLNYISGESGYSTHHASISGYPLFIRTCNFRI